MKTIIVIDDNDIDILVAHKMLEKRLSETHIISFTSAHDASEVILTGKISQPVVMVDLEMPTMDGWRFIKKINERRYACPIYILTVLPHYTVEVDKTVAHLVKGVFRKPLSDASILKLATDNEIPIRSL